MDKKIFKSELFAYINFFEQKKLQPEALSYEPEQINLAVKHSIIALNVLSNRFQKESKSNCDKFLKNIDVMKHDLKDTEFETVYEVLEEILDDLEFLKVYVKDGLNMCQSIKRYDIAIQELEKVNEILTDTIIEVTQNEFDLNKLCYLEDISKKFYEKIQQHINELEGNKKWKITN